MAQTGGAAAYQRLTVPKDGTSQALQHWGSLEASKNAAKKLADERAAVRKAASDKAIQEKYKVDLTKFKIADAGYADENAANIALSEEIAGRYADTMYDAEQLALSGDYAGARELENKAKQLELQFGNEKQAMSAHAEQYKALMKNAPNISGYSKGFENFYKGALTSQGKVLKTLNDDGEVIHVVDVEENGEVKRIVVPSREVVDGTWRAYEKVDLQGDTTTVAESLGDIKREGSSGYNNTETIAWDDGVEGGKGIHSEAVRKLFMAKLGSVDYASDMVDQFDLYEQFDIDEDNPEVNRKFTEDEKNVILDKIIPLVRAKYDETFSSKHNNAKYATDASNARANNKTKTPEEAIMSKLHYDAEQFERGDYTGLLGKFTNEYDEEKTITNVIPSDKDNTVYAVTDDGERIPVTKTKRGFLEFKLRGNSEYKKYSPDGVLDQPAEAYRQGTVGQSTVTDVLSAQYDSDGKFIGEETPFVNQLRTLYPNANISEANIGTNAVKVNGVEINLDTSTKQQVETALNKALNLKSNTKKITW